jgi:hypothetical protein
VTSDALGHATFMIPQSEPAEGDFTPRIPVVTIHYDARG